MIRRREIMRQIGHTDFMRGVKRCPVDIGGQDRVWWREGWRSAQVEAKYSKPEEPKP